MFTFGLGISEVLITSTYCSVILFGFVSSPEAVRYAKTENNTDTAINLYVFKAVLSFYNVRYKGFVEFTATMPGLPVYLKNKIELCITALPANPS